MSRIVAFVARVECNHCAGKGNVPGGQREYGELVKCPVCDGKRTVAGEVPFEAFRQLILGVAKELTHVGVNVL